MTDQPFGSGPYFCKRHPAREVVAPIALRLCAQCMEDAYARYADSTADTVPGKYDELSPDGRSIQRDNEGFYKPRNEII